MDPQGGGVKATIKVEADRVLCLAVVNRYKDEQTERRIRLDGFSVRD
jgi:hypothetical protein